MLVAVGCVIWMMLCCSWVCAIVLIGDLVGLIVNSVVFIIGFVCMVCVAWFA